LILPEASIAVNILHQMRTVATLAASCPPLLQQALEQSEADELARILKVLADPARLRLLSLIQAQPDGEACVCHLVEPLGLAQGTVSHHLKALLTAGLVTREQRGSWAYYRVAPEALDAVRALLA
jgi:ArsR family transcriptional regulator, arsenate/arsenite/antimonite-responsive transcriptional repressor